MSEELLYNQLYYRTKDFGRTQFIKELMRLERENQQLKEENQQLKENYESVDKGMAYLMEQRDLYKSVIDEIRKYIKKLHNYHIEYGLQKKLILYASEINFVSDI